MFRKNSSTTKKMMTFYMDSHLYEKPVDDLMALCDRTTFKDPDAQTTIERNHESAAGQHYINITVKDEQKEITARFSENTCWQKTRMSLTTKEGTFTKELKGATAEKKCEELFRFFEVNKLAANLFCATSKGRDLEDALREEGYQVLKKK